MGRALLDACEASKSLSPPLAAVSVACGGRMTSAHGKVRAHVTPMLTALVAAVAQRGDAFSFEFITGRAGKS